MGENFYQVCQSRMGTGPFLKDEDRHDLLSYKDLDMISAQYANFFFHLGIRKGDRVVAQVEKSAHNLLIYFACLRSGLIFIPLNTAYQTEELQYFLANSEPSLVICDPGTASTFDKLAVGESRKPQVLTLDASGSGTVNAKLGSFPTEHEIVDCEADEVAVILYTSGTTGKPKGAMITHDNLASNGLALLDTWDWQVQDTMLHALPIFHIHGLFVATHLPVLNASPIIFLNKFDVDTIIENLPHATVYMGVPTNYTRLLADKNFDKRCCRKMRLFTSGSAPLLTQTFTEFQTRTGHTIVERYGMTETGMNTSNPLSGEQKPGTVGLPLRGVEIKVVTDGGIEVSPGNTGNLLVKGENLFKGYWKLETKTREEFTDEGFFKTGDLAQLDEDGYVSIVGRSKDMIISGGLNVYPKEIESIIDQMPGVTESAVIGVTHADFGEAVTAVVVRSDNSLTEQALRSHMKSKVANFKVAKNVYFIEELPRNTMGKVQKNILREMFSKSA